MATTQENTSHTKTQDDKPIPHPSGDICTKEPLTDSFKHIFWSVSHTPVCVICVCHVNVKVPCSILKTTKECLLKNEICLSIQAYEQTHGTMNSILMKQYELPGYLSSRAHWDGKSFEVCSASSNT